MPKPCEIAARKLPKRCFWNLLKTKKKPASYQAKLKKKVFGTRMRKSRTPAGFVPKPLRNRSQENAKRRFWNPLKRKKYSAQTMRNRSRKTAETLLLEPTKNKEKRLRKVASSKAQRNIRLGSLQATRPTQEKGVWGAHAKRQTPAGLAPKPLPNRSRKNAETSLLEPIKIKKKEIVPKPCETAARKLPKRCFRNLLKTKKIAFGTY